MIAPFSPSTLAVFSELLGSVQLPLAHPDFEAMAARAATAKKELAAALAEAQGREASPGE